MDDGSFLRVDDDDDDDDELMNEAQRAALRAYGVESEEDELNPTSPPPILNPWKPPPATLSLAAPAVELAVAEHCVICMEAVDADDGQNLTLPCKHTFHAACIRTVRCSPSRQTFAWRAGHDLCTGSPRFCCSG